MFCPLLEKDAFIENVYIVLSCPINSVLLKPRLFDSLQNASSLTCFRSYIYDVASLAVKMLGNIHGAFRSLRVVKYTNLVNIVNRVRCHLTVK